MTIAELSTPVEQETRAVFKWRFSQLSRSGYSLGEALALAVNGDVDLHRAADLVAGGCPPSLALRILL
jgi:malonyl CoA-acyl carrier protein transacylase